MADLGKLKVTITEIKANLHPQREEVINVPAKLPVFTDKKTGVKSVSFPFQFTDGVPGFLTATRLVKLGWEPGNDIESITIKFK